MQVILAISEKDNIATLLTSFNFWGPRTELVNLKLN